MKKYSIIKYILFFLPFIIAICIELFVLPIDYFTFRAWETLSARRSFGILKGPFYPDIVITMTEMGGDLDSQTKCAVKKDVIWITDQYGYRKANTSSKRFPVVIVGDSNLAGGSLTQDDTLANVLEKRLDRGVYPLAPESLKTIFEHGLLKQFPPDIIILESIERNILTCTLKMSKERDFGKLPMWNKILLKVQLTRTIQSIAITFDRIFKANMLNYLRARINKTALPDIKGSGTAQCPILFLQGAAANNDISIERINAFALDIKNASDFFTSKGIRFIFLPIPNKENIHQITINEYPGNKRGIFYTKIFHNVVQIFQTLHVTFSPKNKRMLSAG